MPPLSLSNNNSNVSIVYQDNDVYVTSLTVTAIDDIEIDLPKDTQLSRLRPEFTFDAFKINPETSPSNTIPVLTKPQLFLLLHCNHPLYQEYVEDVFLTVGDYIVIRLTVYDNEDLVEVRKY